MARSKSKQKRRKIAIRQHNRQRRVKIKAKLMAKKSPHPVVKEEKPKRAAKKEQA
jgi:hypothetical protein